MEAYEMIAKITGGSFVRFGPDMPLKDLVEALFEYNIKGPKEFKKGLPQASPAVKALINGGLLRLSPPKEDK